MQQTTVQFGKLRSIGDTETIHVDGFDVTATVVHDDDMGAPWVAHDGHGQVTNWIRDAPPDGCRLIHQDGPDCQYYLWDDAIADALRDGWDAPPYGGDPQERAERAVQADFARMQSWCRSEWCWAGVVLSVAKAGHVLVKHAAGLYGIESDAEGYFSEAANKLIGESVEAGRKVLVKLAT